MFSEKYQALKEKEELQGSQSLETTIEQACKIVPKLNIPEDSTATAKVRKLVAAVCASKDDISRVTFDFQMNI